MRSKRNLEVELSWPLLSELKEKRYRGSNRYASDSAETGRRRTACWGIPDRSDRRCATKHCVPCWNRSFDGDFHPSSYGYARAGQKGGGRAHQAISKAQLVSFALPASLGSGYGPVQMLRDTLDHDRFLAPVSGVR